MSTRYVAMINTPGYLPEGEPAVFDSLAEAWTYLADERQAHEDDYWQAYDGPEAEDDDDEVSPTVRELRRRARYAAHGAAEGGVGTVTASTEPLNWTTHDLGLAYSVDVYDGPADEDDECAHEWVAGIMVVHDEDVEAVAAKRPVECSKCEALYAQRI